MNDLATLQAEQGSNNLLNLTANIVTAFVSNANSHMTGDALSDMIKSTYSTLSGLTGGAPAVEAEQAPVKKEPAVSIRKSVQPEFLICLHDGKKVTMLKRYLRTNFNQTPEQYRAEFNLPSDYPMVAPNYSERRRTLAKQIGLGTKGRGAAAAIEALAEVTETDADTVKADVKAETPSNDTPKRRGRPPAAKKQDAAPAKRRGRRPKAETAQAA